MSASKEGVSPIVAVALLVAITVVAAVVTYLYTIGVIKGWLGGRPEYSGGMMSIESVDVNTKDIVAYWRFDEGLGASSTDIVRGALTAELKDGASFAADGAVGSCVELQPDGSDRIALPYKVCNGLADFALVVWVKIDDINTSSYHTLISGANSGEDDAILFRIRRTAAGEAREVCCCINGSEITFSTPNLADGNWHQLVWVRTGDQSTLYVDGNLIGTQTHVSDTITTDSTGGLLIGENQDKTGGGLTDSLDGWVDEVCVMEAPLSQHEVEAMYKNTSCLVLDIHVRNTGGTTLKISDSYLEAVNVFEHLTRSKMVFSGDGILEKGETETVYIACRPALVRTKLYTITLVSERGVQSLLEFQA